jgi:hypothetical protein
MKNLIKTIECNIHHCLHSFHSFNNKQAKGTHHFLDAVFTQRNLVMLLFILLLPIFSIVAQDQKAIKTHLQEDKIYYTPQLAGSSPMSKPATVNTSIRNHGEILSGASRVQQIKKTSSPMTWSQLTKQMSTTKNMLSDVTVYSGIGNQRSPQIASLGNEMFAAFESDDIQGGTYPFGSIDVYYSSDGGATWSYFNGLSHPSYRLTSPQILLVGKEVIVTYVLAGSLGTYRWGRSDGSSFASFIPVPTVSTNEYVVDHRLVSDVEEYTTGIYLYMAFLFKQADGKNRVLFSISQDTAQTWQPYDSLGLSQSELKASSIGLDYSSSGLYLAYLGTDANAGSIVLRKSTSFGSSWTPEIILPMDVNGGMNKKVGPMVAAWGQRVAVIYQYDYVGDATDWKTGSDFDVYAVVSDSGGTSWHQRMVSSTFSNEILPNVTSDYDGNFYVSFMRDGKTRVSMAGSEFVFGLPDSSSTANVSLDDFPSIYGSTISGTHTAYTAWTGLSTTNGLDIYGAAVTLKIPPLSPSNLFATVVSNSEIKLSWTDNSLDESGFVIYYRKTGSGAGFTQIASVSTDVTSCTVTGLSPIGYDFYVRAYNANGLSLRTNIASATPGGGITIAPSAPANLIATASNAQVTLRWDKNTEADFLRYRIYGGTSTSPTTKIDSTTGDIADTTKTITGLTNGTTYYFRITAVNNAGAESGFSNEVSSKPNAIVDNTPPTFTVGPNVTGVPVIVNASGDVVSSPLPQVNASASDGESGVSRMQVVYRNTSEQNWSKSPFDSSGTISFPIPTNKFVYNNKPIGVNYRVGAWDKAGNVRWSPYNSIDVQLGPQATDKSFDMPAASKLSNKSTAYRMISVPYDLPDKQPVSLLSNFGDHKENTIAYARWRLQRWFNGQYQDYDQFSTENVITPGAAFFFIVRDQGTQIIVKGASIVRSDDMYSKNISVKNGWNLIGNPFTIPYPVDSLEFINTSMIGRAYYSGSGSVGGWELTGANVAFIQPWQGIAIKVNSDGTMKFPSVGQKSGLPKLKSTLSIERSEPTQAKNLSNWTIPINAYRSDIDMRCEGGAVGMAQGANEGDDQYDVYIPPFVGDKNIAVYFNNSEGAMLRDIRPLNDEGGVWEMCVVTGDAGARVKLQLGDKLNLPNQAFEAYLIDVDQKMAYNLKEVQSLEINSGNGIRNLRVVVGKKSFVEGNNAGVALTPSSMKLYANYPNPFNPETVIRYTVPDASSSYTVTLKIFNVLGQEIATLVNEQKSAGYYEVKWNALQQSSGVYLYQLSITDGSKSFQDIKKMVLMK